MKEMKQTNAKIVSITLCTLSMAATVFPVAVAVNTTEEQICGHIKDSSTKYLMTGLILLHYEVIVDTWFIYGFRAIAVLCIQYQNEIPVGCFLLGPRYYFDFDDYICEGFVGYFMIRAVVTER
jgi:hypothetical protein